MTTNHTPTPWTQHNGEIFAERDDFGTMQVAQVMWRNPASYAEYGGAQQAEADTAFIVTACNAHDELVAALREILKASLGGYSTVRTAAIARAALVKVTP